MNFQEFFSGLLNFEWLESLVLMFFWVLIKFVGLVLLPFKFILQTFFPDIGGFDVYIHNFFVLVNKYINWIADATLIPGVAWKILISYLIFSYTITWVIWVGKMLLKWVGHFR